MAHLVPSGQPGDVGSEAHQRVARSFYLVRMARLSVLLAFALVFLAVTAATDEPGWAVAVFGVLTLAVLSLLWRTRRRWRTAAASWQ